MKYSKKMVLVPADNVEKEPKEKDSLPPDIITDSIHRLDNKMKTILNNNSLSIQEKVRYYSNALDDYLLFIDKFKHREKPNKVIYDDSDDDDDDTIKKKQLSNFSIAREALEKTLAPSLVKKGEIILDYLERSGTHSLSSKGELIHNGRIIPNSNIIDLVHHKLRTRKKIVDPPHAYSIFHQTLFDINVPHEILKTGNRKAISFSPKKSFTSEKGTRKSKRLISRPPVKKRKKDNENSWEPWPPK